MAPNLPENARRRLAVMRFVTTATEGDVDGFIRSMTAIDWPGAWRDILGEVARIGQVHPDVRPFFRAAWHGWPHDPSARVMIAGRNKWSLTRDLADDLDLLAAMRVLLPPEDHAPAPYILYRGLSIPEQESNNYGLWWTPDALYAEFYARDPRRSSTGRGVVVAAFLPEDAIVCSVSGAEYLLDPRRITDVICVQEMPVYTQDDFLYHQPTPYQHGTPSGAYMLGMPMGWDARALDQWLALGRPEEGLEACRTWREAIMDDSLRAM